MRNLRLLKDVLLKSKIMKWCMLAFTIFGILQFVRDEFLKSSTAEKLHIVSFLPHWSWRSWGLIILGCLLATFAEGILSWYGEDILPILGPVGSLQFGAIQAAARIAACTDSFIQANGPPPVASVNANKLLEEQWKWEKGFSEVFDADVKGDLRAVLLRLEREKLQSVNIQNAVSLCTIQLQQALDAYTDLLHLSFRSRKTDAPLVQSITQHT